MIRALYTLAGACTGLALVYVGVLRGDIVGNWAIFLGWIVPGLLGLVVGGPLTVWVRPDWRPAAAVVAAAVIPTFAVGIGAMAAGRMGGYVADSGVPLQVWIAELGGRGVYEQVVATGESALVDMILLVTAPLVALPAGLGIAAWGLSLQPDVRPWAVATLVAGITALGGLPTAPSVPLTSLAMATFCFALLAGGLGRWTPWATAVGVAAIHSLSSIGYLLQLGFGQDTAWTHVFSWSVAGMLGLLAATVPIGKEYLDDE